VAYLITFGIPLLAFLMLTNTKNSEKGKNRNSDDIQTGVVVKESDVRRSPEGSRIIAISSFRIWASNPNPRKPASYPPLPCPALPWWFPRYTKDPENQTLTRNKLDDEDQTLTRNKLEDEEEEDNKP
jgi:hypothetical protein